MARIIKWDETAKRFFETGVDRGVLFVQASDGTYPQGVPWNGLMSVQEAPEGADVEDLYANNNKYLSLVGREDFKATIEAYVSPVEFDACDGTVEVATGVSVTQQNRTRFGLAYRSLIGNDIDGQDHAYKLHLVYGALAQPSSRDRETVGENVEAMSLSWEISTVPEMVTDFKPTAHMVIDSRYADPTLLAEFEAILYGEDDPVTVEPRLPLPDEVKTLLTVV